MSAELCRRPRAFRRLMKNRRAESRSLAEVTSFLEGRITQNYIFGEPIASTRSVKRAEVVAPPIKEKMIEEVVLIDNEKIVPVDSPHFLLEDPMVPQYAKISEALERRRTGNNTPRWKYYLQHVLAYLAVDHKLATREEDIV